MTSDEAFGWLIVGLINDHFPHPDDPLVASNLGIYVGLLNGLIDGKQIAGDDEVPRIAELVRAA